MCHAACFPAPKTAMEWTLERRLKMMVEARAVRKAVSSSAARKAYGLPLEVRRVREPRGVVDWEEANEGSVDLELAMEGVWDTEGKLDLGLAVEGDCGAGDELLDELRGESMLSLLMLGSRDGFPARAKVRILMPLLVLVLAGMNSVVCLSAAGIAIRWG